MEKHRITMGNLFSGSGTWELAAKICGIDVIFESEIEPFPVALEAKRFPEAIQLGDNQMTIAYEKKENLPAYTLKIRGGARHIYET